MTFQQWQTMERAKVAERLKQLGRRKPTYIEQRLIDARLDCIRDGRAEYERFVKAAEVVDVGEGGLNQ
jgi:hypothetical protein